MRSMLMRAGVGIVGGDHRAMGGGVGNGEAEGRAPNTNSDCDKPGGRWVGVLLQRQQLQNIGFCLPSVILVAGRQKKKDC